MLIELQDQGLIHTIHFDVSNIGLEAARQSLWGMETHGEFFVDVDNDCLPPPPQNGKDWLERMLDIMEDHENLAALSQRTQVMIGTGNIFERADEDGDRIVEFPHPGGSFRLMRTRAVNGVNGWDRQTPGRGSEEKLICSKLRDAGWDTAFAVQIPCVHLFGTRGKDGTDRWGYPKDWAPEQTGHSDIWHPALNNGDSYELIEAYCGKELADGYFNNQAE
jgi:hypothetical protein